MRTYLMLALFCAIVFFLAPRDSDPKALASLALMVFVTVGAAIAFAIRGLRP